MKAKDVAVSAIIATLYVVMTVFLGPLAYANTINVRPAEALTILPLFTPYAIIGLFVGCLISNIPSAFGFFDVVVGSLVTLLAAICTRKSKNVWIGGVFPVLLNAIFLPIVYWLAGSTGSYFAMFWSIFATQTIWVYGLGVPLYFALKKMKWFENKK